MKIIAPHNWIPADDMHLEDAALEAVKAPNNVLVIAGPGSGKTELLAQKACYLLQTNICSWPRRIMAISFKVDAANNLRARVQKRCGPELSGRFDSWTFDSLSKNIFDRLRRGLPEGYRIGRYNLNMRMGNDITYAFRSVDPQFYNTASVGNYSEYLTSLQLPFNENDENIEVLRKVWNYLTQKNSPDLNFPMIMRLSDLIVNCNPFIKDGFRQIYSHVFIDEFQDTTHIQYDLFKTLFLGSKVRFTAVGDDKQSIMGWAGAKPAIFDEYAADTGAADLRLLMNWRSAPRLIAFQNYLVDALLGKPAVAIPSDKWGGGEGEVRMCFFPEPNAERQYLIEQIGHWLNVDKLDPREISILVKQLPPNYTAELIAELNTRGIMARDESNLQDLLTEPFPVFMINFLESVFGERLGHSWDDAFSFLCNINQSYEDDKINSLQRNSLKFVKQWREQTRNPDYVINGKALTELMVSVMNFVDLKKVKDNFPQYKEGTWLIDMMKQMRVYLLEQFSSGGSFLSAISALRGENAIPIMTTHKSKGLEFHTVVFIGLEDSAFWTYRTQSTDDNNLFFVALSRAKERMLFTFCQNRPLPRNGGPQTAAAIATIHELIKSYNDIVIIDSTQ